MASRRSNECTQTDISNLTQHDTENDIPPDGGYGWVCVAACFAGNAFTWGLVSTYGVFLSYYLSHDIFPGSSPLDYALIGGLTFGTAMLVAPLVTHLTRIKIHPPMYLGAIFLGAGFITASYATKIWHLYLSQGVLEGMGVGFFYVPTIPVISQWFDTRRSLANGITAAGSGIGGLIFSLAAGSMIDTVGLGWALRVIGIIGLIMNLISATFIKDRRAVLRPEYHPFKVVLLLRWDVIFLLSWAFISMLGYITLLYSLSDFAKTIGLSSSQAVQVTALLNLGTALGRPFIGVASDRFGRFEVAAGLTLFCGLCCFVIWIPATSFGVTVLFGMISGAILGVFWVTIGPLCVEVVGLKLQPSLLALSWLIVVLPTTFSEVIALYLKRPESSRPYLFTQIFCGGCYMVASASLWMTKRKCDGKARNE